MTAKASSGPIVRYHERLTYLKGIDAQRNDLISVSTMVTSRDSISEHITDKKMQELIDSLEGAQAECRQYSMDLEAARRERRLVQQEVHDLRSLPVSMWSDVNAKTNDAQASTKWESVCGRID